MKREYDFSHAKRGPVIKPEPRKTRITIRIDNEVMDWFRHQAHLQGGASYQTLINQALHRAIKQEPLVNEVRKAVREEIRKALPKPTARQGAGVALTSVSH